MEKKFFHIFTHFWWLETYKNLLRNNDLIFVFFLGRGGGDAKSLPFNAHVMIMMHIINKGSNKMTKCSVKNKDQVHAIHANNMLRFYKL